MERGRPGAPDPAAFLRGGLPEQDQGGLRGDRQVRAAADRRRAVRPDCGHPAQGSRGGQAGRADLDRLPLQRELGRRHNAAGPIDRLGRSRLDGVDEVQEPGHHLPGPDGTGPPSPNRLEELMGLSRGAREEVFELRGAGRLLSGQDAAARRRCRSHPGRQRPRRLHSRLRLRHRALGRGRLRPVPEVQEAGYRRAVARQLLRAVQGIGQHLRVQSQGFVLTEEMTMKTKTLRALSLGAGLALVTVCPVMAQPNFTKYVALGDSYGAGYSAGCLVARNQQFSYPNILAKQFGISDFQQPTVSDPGLPVCTGLTSLVPVTFGPISTSKVGAPTNALLARSYDNLSIPNSKAGDV